MTLNEISKLLSCEVFCGENLLYMEIKFGCASDLMSDVLAFSRSGALLLTGLVNTQTIHTAFIADINAVVFVRRKKPDDDMVALAREKKIPLLGTSYSMYEAAGILYKNGLFSTMECKSVKTDNE
jgi:predicted transcriptional regulator